MASGAAENPCFLPAGLLFSRKFVSSRKTGRKTRVTRAPAAEARPVDYRRLLKARRDELAAALEEARFDTLARLGRVAEDDQAQLTHEEFISLHRNSLEYAQLRLVEQALDRLEAGAFGVCLGCERPISPKRLEAIPWAEFCVECQERAGAPEPAGSEPQPVAEPG
jgi:DnaK suppressor protein